MACRVPRKRDPVATATWNMLVLGRAAMLRPMQRFHAFWSRNLAQKEPKGLFRGLIARLSHGGKATWKLLPPGSIHSATSSPSGDACSEVVASGAVIASMAGG